MASWHEDLPAAARSAVDPENLRESNEWGWLLIRRDALMQLQAALQTHDREETRTG